MATFFSGAIVGFWVNSTNYIYGTLTGDVSRSGNTVTLSNMKLALSTRYSGTGSSGFTFTVGGTSTSGTIYISGTSLGTMSLNNASIAVNTADTSKSVSWSSSDGKSGAFTVSFNRAPYGGYINGVTSEWNTSASEIQVSTTSAGCSTGGATLTALNWSLCDVAYASGVARRSRSLTNGSSSTLSNSLSTYTGTTIDVAPNKRLYLGLYAANSIGDYRYQGGTVITVPGPLSASLADASTDSLTISYTTYADSGYYTKTIEYSLDGGSTWVAGATVTKGASTTRTFVISGLSVNTEYTVNTRVTTTAGSTVGDTVTGKTVGVAVPTIAFGETILISATSQSRTIIWGVSSFGGGTNQSVVLQMRTSPSSSWRTLDTKTTTGNNTYTHTGVTENCLYYYRAVATATIDGEEYTEASSSLTTKTRCNSPTLSNLTQTYTASDKVTVTGTLSHNVLSSWSNYGRQILYRYLFHGGDHSGSWSAWLTAAATSISTLNLSADFTIQNVPTDAYIDVEYKTNNTNTYNYAGAGDSYVLTNTTKTLNTLPGPSGFDYSLYENNAVAKNFVEGITSEKVFINEMSQMGVSVPQSTAGTPADESMAIDHYVFTAGGRLKYLYYSSDDPMEALFTAPTPTGQSSVVGVSSYNVSGTVYDSFGGSTTVYQPYISVTYEAPTITVTAERLNQQGQALVVINGVYSGLSFGGSINSGADNNPVRYYYRVLDYDGSVRQDWTEFTNVTVTKDTDTGYRRFYEGRATLSNVSGVEDSSIEVKIEDVFNSVKTSATLEVWEGNRILYPPVYDVELWNWKTNTFVADISNLIDGDLNIEWILNDVEQVSFDMDLLQFEKKCEEMGLDPSELLKPYKHDIRIRRNREYIVGCQLVDVTIKINNNPPAKISVKGTGYLNLLKDQYIMQEAWGSFTYAQIARRLVETAQKPDSLLKNPTFDIDVGYWLTGESANAYYTADPVRGDGCLRCSASNTSQEVVIGSQMTNEAGQVISGDLYVKAPSGQEFWLQERQYFTDHNGASTIETYTGTGSWQHIQFSSYTTRYNNSYFCVRGERNPMYLDEVYIYWADDEATLCDLKIPLGVDTATEYQSADRVVDYSLQNVKDALMDLTAMEDDNFDFEFLPDRTFNVYRQKGSEKLNLEIAYPGNIDSMTISRSASNVANKIYNIGSGIGDERLQTYVSDTDSRTEYGTRESILTNSNVELVDTLKAQAEGTLKDRKNPTNLPTVTIKDGSVNPSNLKTGDIVLLTVNGDSFLGTINDSYRVMKISCSVSENAVETMKITVEEYLSEG